MHYLPCIGLPLLWQSTLMATAILMLHRDSTYLGLGPFLLGIVAIPLTAMLNLGQVHANWTASLTQLMLRCNVMAGVVSLGTALAASVGAALMV